MGRCCAQSDMYCNHRLALISTHYEINSLLPRLVTRKRVYGPIRPNKDRAVSGQSSREIATVNIFSLVVEKEPAVRGLYDLFFIDLEVTPRFLGETGDELFR